MISIKQLKIITINKPAQFGGVIAGVEVVPLCFGIVVITAVADGVEFGYFCIAGYFCEFPP